jgi:hypothetical protein
MLFEVQGTQSLTYHGVSTWPSQCPTPRHSRILQAVARKSIIVKGAM